MLMIIILAAAAVIVLLEVLRELHTFRVTRYEISSPKLKGLKGAKKIVLLSDLHNREYGKNNSRLLASIDECKPELILIAGDMIVAKPGYSMDTAKIFLKALSKRYPVYYEKGNHEQRLGFYPEKYGNMEEQFYEMIKECGIHLLSNETKTVFFDKVPVCITGLEIAKHFYKRKGHVSMSLSYLQETLGEKKENYYHILLAHNPDYFQAYRQWGADLTLSGHLHGGLVRIPGAGGVISPHFRLFPKYSGGLYTEENETLVLSRGLGTHTINIRLFNTPELVELTLREAK